jgi:hypothetical protein
MGLSVFVNCANKAQKCKNQLFNLLNFDDGAYIWAISLFNLAKTGIFVPIICIIELNFTQIVI